MSTIKIENRSNAQCQREKTTEEFINEYKTVLESTPSFSKDVVEFSEIMAKHPADIFIVTSFPKGERCEQIRQGDVYLFRKGDETEGSFDNVQYAKYAPTVKNIKEPKNKSMNLQFGEAITGDHKVVPLKGTKCTVMDCTIDLPVKNDFGRDAEYNVKIIKADGPFAVTHREHGNITCPQGTYLACVQMDPRTLSRVQD